LIGAGETRFIDNVEMPLLWGMPELGELSTSSTAQLSSVQVLVLIGTETPLN
jgi:hypothetical protein